MTSNAAFVFGYVSGIIDMVELTQGNGFTPEDLAELVGEFCNRATCARHCVEVMTEFFLAAEAMSLVQEAKANPPS
jgi:hypothetical protein